MSAADIPPTLPHPTDAPLDVAAVIAALSGVRLGHPLHYYPTIASTNTATLDAARAGELEGLLITTDDQHAGRGRIGRAWRSLPNQQLAFSLLLRPTFPMHYLALASAVAVAEALDELTDLRATIKWPNDIHINRRKVSGILIETQDGAAALGIGLNVNGSLAHDTELAARATTLAQALGALIPREPLLAAIVRHLDAHYTALSAPPPDNATAWAQLHATWRARLETLGQRVRIQGLAQPLTGHAEDVDADGALLVRDDAGALHRIAWGDIETVSLTPSPQTETHRA